MTLYEHLSGNPEARRFLLDFVIRYSNRVGKPYLTAQEVRELAAQNCLDEPDLPRPAPQVYANQSTVFLQTYHRCRLPRPARMFSGAWTARSRDIPLTPRLAQILLTRFTGYIHPNSRKRLERVAHGWQPRQRKPRSAQQALYA